MSISGIRHGALRMYGGFIFKQWKKRFLQLTAEGSLLVCHDAMSPPDQVVVLQNSCEAIVQGKEILDLPKLPSGGCRECCFALILPHNKYLLLLADTPEECSQWLNMLKKVKESVSSPLHPCKRHRVPTPGIHLNDLVPEQTTEKDLPTPPISDVEASSQGSRRDGSQREKNRKSPHIKRNKGSTSLVGCLRHGTANNAQSVRAVYLLMGGAAASSAMGYLGAGSATNLEVNANDLPPNTNFSDIGTEVAYHSGSHVGNTPHFHSFDYEMVDADFDAFDYSGFAF